MRRMLLLLIMFSSFSLHAAAYKVENIPGPQGATLEVGGIAFTPNGTLMVTTRWGEIWALKDNRWSLFATGLHEPLGLVAASDSELFVLQRPELTRVKDTDNDGPADVFECLSAAWYMNGMETEYSFGLVRDKDGNFWGALAPDWDSSPKALYRSWSFRVTPKGEFTPWSSGLRNANGLVISPEGELFATDNQGEWVGTSPLHHIRRGDFHGFAFDITKYEPFKNMKMDPAELNKIRKPPAILFPYDNIARSPSQPVFDLTGGKFGPFEGQIFISDQLMPTFMRVALEKVDGEYQGACFPFLENKVARGGNRLAFAPDGSLYVGQTVRGWLGSGNEGLQRISWNGPAVNEIHSISLTPTGFEFTMTQPVDRARATNKQNYNVKTFRYLYHATYGSPEVDIAGVEVKEIKVSEDGKKISLTLPEIKTGRIYEFKTDLGLDYRRAYYTVNKLRKP
jgi:hypothetical protein